MAPEWCYRKVLSLRNGKFNFWRCHSQSWPGVQESKTGLVLRVAGILRVMWYYVEEFREHFHCVMVPCDVPVWKKYGVFSMSWRLMIATTLALKGWRGVCSDMRYVSCTCYIIALKNFWETREAKITYFRERCFVALKSDRRLLRFV